MDRVQTKLPNQKMLWAGFALASRLDVGQIRVAVWMGFFRSLIFANKLKNFYLLLHNFWPLIFFSTKISIVVHSSFRICFNPIKSTFRGIMGLIKADLFTSDLPRRSRLEMSKVSPTAAVSTPPVPRFCSLRLSKILLKRKSCSGGYSRRREHLCMNLKVFLIVIFFFFLTFHLNSFDWNWTRSSHCEMH